MSLVLRAHVAAAAHSVVPSWPIESFIAVNPLASYETEHFEAASSSEVALTRGRDDYFSDLGAGRLSTADLETVLLDRIPGLTGVVQVGDATMTAVQVAIVDMTTAEWARTGQTQSGTPWLDGYLAKWLASYLDPQPLWPMPYKSEGFYRAWHALSRRDPSVPRSARRKLREAPAQADAALAWALGQLSILPHDVRPALAQELAPFRDG